MDCACPIFDNDKTYLGRFFNQKKTLNPETGKPAPGNDCHTIALLHVLMNYARFRDYLKNNFTPDQLENRPITKVLKRLLQGFIKHPCKLPEKGHGYFWNDPTVIEQPMNPKDLLQFLPAFDRDQQEDMVEVFRKVIEELAREEMIMENQGAIEPTETSGDNNDIEVVTARHIGNSKIRDMFTWIIKTTFNCKAKGCGKENTFYDTPTDILVNIPKPNASRDDRNLNQCLPRSAAFHQVFEKRCSECNSNNNITANSIVVKSPDIALLQVGRNDGTDGNNKLKTEVVFPKRICFDNLGLQDSDLAKPENKDLKKHKIGVLCNHHGVHTNAGHYTTFAMGIEREKGKWKTQCYLSNDDKVMKVLKDDVDDSESRMESYCFAYYKESRRPDVDVPVSRAENVQDNDFDNPLPGPSTANIPSKGTFLI